MHACRPTLLLDETNKETTLWIQRATAEIFGISNQTRRVWTAIYHVDRRRLLLASTLKKQPLQGQIIPLFIERLLGFRRAPPVLSAGMKPLRQALGENTFSVSPEMKLLG